MCEVWGGGVELGAGGDEDDAVLFVICLCFVGY